MKYLILFLTLALVSCDLLKSSEGHKKSTMFIGVDVSGSFVKTREFKDSIAFLSHYIYAHMNSIGDLYRPKDLYVGGIGGNQKDDPLAFYPIHDFEGKSPADIEEKLLKEFTKQPDNLTDFNTYFQRVSTLVKQKNLVLAPINILIITDGVPEVIKGKTGKVRQQAYSKIDLSPIEYLARNVSLRILYASPKVGNEWLKWVPTSRVKIWPVEAEVMFGWKNQLAMGQEKLWKWISDNIDRRVYKVRVADKSEN